MALLPKLVHLITFKLNLLFQFSIARFGLAVMDLADLQLLHEVFTIEQQLLLFPNELLVVFHHVFVLEPNALELKGAFSIQLFFKFGVF